MRNIKYYDVIDKKGPFEIRKYPVLFKASVVLRKDLRKRFNKGFQILLAYIDGKNKKKSKLPIVAPMIVELQDDSGKMSFILPNGLDDQKYPEPINDSIQIEKEQEKTYLVLRFSGFATVRKIREKQAKLKQYLEQNQLKEEGPYEFHNFNTPYKLFNRRNEIVVPVDMVLEEAQLI